MVEVTRPSADCQYNVFWTFQAIRKFVLKKVAERSRESGRRSRDRRPTVKQRFLYVSERFGKILKKVAERSRDSGWGHATVGRLSNNVFWTFQTIRNFFELKSLNGHATVVGGHATVGRLSNNVFSSCFKRILKVFEKSRWTFTRQWSEVTRPSTVPTVKQRFLDVFKRFGKFFRKSRRTVTRQWLRSRDRRPTVKQRFFDDFKQFGRMLKTVAESESRNSGRRSYATVGRLSNNVFWTIQAIWENFEKSRRERSRDSGRRYYATIGRLSNNVFRTFQAIRKFFEKSRWTVTRQCVGGARDRRPTVNQRFLDADSWVD